VDEEVERAMARFPDVPDLMGWLALDERCRWRLRGQDVKRPRTIAFFNRHLDHDDEGRWFVQNGPQRAFVDLAYLPLLFTRDETGALIDQRGRPASPIQAAYLDDEGRLIVVGADGPGLLDEAALLAIADLVRDHKGSAVDEIDAAALATGLYLDLPARRLRLDPMATGDVARRLGLVMHPRP